MEENKLEEKYTDGYNNGYLLSRFEPELYKQIAVNLDLENPFCKGLIDGHKAHERELFLKNRQASRKITQHRKPGMK